MIVRSPKIAEVKLFVMELGEVFNEFAMIPEREDDGRMLYGQKEKDDGSKRKKPTQSGKKQLGSGFFQVPGTMICAFYKVPLV
jgi:hypothetical protein